MRLLIKAAGSRKLDRLGTKPRPNHVIRGGYIAGGIAPDVFCGYPSQMPDLVVPKIVETGSKWKWFLRGWIQVRADQTIRIKFHEDGVTGVLVIYSGEMDLDKDIAHIAAEDHSITATLDEVLHNNMNTSVHLITILEGR